MLPASLPAFHKISGSYQNNKQAIQWTYGIYPAGSGFSSGNASWPSFSRASISTLTLKALKPHPDTSALLTAVGILYSFRAFSHNVVTERVVLGWVEPLLRDRKVVLHILS